MDKAGVKAPSSAPTSGVPASLASPSKSSVIAIGVPPPSICVATEGSICKKLANDPVTVFKKVGFSENEAVSLGATVPEVNTPL